VQNSSCSSVPNSMACQTDKQTPPNQYSLAVLNSTATTVYTINSNGLTMSLQDGTLCGGDGFRELTVNFVCSSSATTPVLTGFIEGEVCHYTANVMTAAVCSGSVVTTSSSGGSQSLTGSTGGPSNPSSAALSASTTSFSLLLICIISILATLAL
jgi:hypothetical protein